MISVPLDLIKDINDPEHPLTLEELNVLQEAQIEVNDAKSTLNIEFTPTIPHCSMATLIGLSIRVKLLRVLPERFKVLCVCVINGIQNKRFFMITMVTMQGFDKLINRLLKMMFYIIFVFTLWSWNVLVMQ